MVEAVSKVKSLSFPKKLDLGKRRLVKLLEELDQLLEERAALREIEERLRISDEHYRQVEESQEKFETTLNDDEAKTAMDEWTRFRKTFRKSQAKARALIDEMRAVDVVPGSMRSAETDRNIRLPQCVLPMFDGVYQQKDLADAGKPVYLRNCLTADAVGAIAGLTAANADYQVAVRRIKKRKDAALTAADCLITVARELLPEQTRIKWDELTMEDELAQSDLS
ncbi:hypothetical protein T01_7463 [Trichinella spiralis]|uniref:Uncharacterized protein n=1 Tax=Trichinella spiralis TaxID=6334 RepID=A0A0V1BV22_TRISP|nr:hypothetical protein T01_7463 [Trichinella spiralis]